MAEFKTSDGTAIIAELIVAVQANKQYLSDIDGAIGDGDHGINMNKGFTRCDGALHTEPGDLAHCLETLSKALMMIGGCMGPLYGLFFRSMAGPCRASQSIDAGDTPVAQHGPSPRVRSSTCSVLPALWVSVTTRSPSVYSTIQASASSVMSASMRSMVPSGNTS